jgi:DNA-binding SARP family transcriptional activator/tetratricopeptide (TPR) repeat protein
VERPLQLRLLGPVEAWDGERQVRLEGPRQRLVLAALALDVGRSVPLAGLVNTIWGDDPPATAKQQVQSSISALRRVLGGAIVTTASGYELSVPAELVDVHVFEAEVADARRCAAGDPRRAAERLRDALALWRGSALTGMPGLAAQAVRLEERRLAVLEERIDLDLEVGRHADLVAELSGLVAAHPLRERLIAQLMLALYRSGRQSDALQTYRLAEVRMAAELGLDPGDELRRLRLAILRADPALDAPASTPSRGGHGTVSEAMPGQLSDGKAPAVVPAQLPPEVADFTGRAGCLSALMAMLSDETGRSPQVVVVSAIAGTAGVGKTALAVHWAHRIRDRYPDGQLHVNLRGHAAVTPLRPIEALARFLHALGIPAERVPTGVEEASAMYRTLLANKRMLVLLDNAASADQVRPLLPGTGGCLVVVTSRDQLAGLIALDGARRLTLDVLTPDESAALLGRILGEDRVGAEPGAVAELARLCAYLPLALRIAAANLTGRPNHTIAGYTAELRTNDRLSALHVPGDEQAAVRATFDLSYTALPEAPRRLFRLLGLVPGPDVTVEAAAVLADATPEEAARLLARLAGGHLIDQHVPGRFACHDLLRLYAAERARQEDGEPDRQAALARLFSFYLQTVDRAAKMLYPQIQRLPPAIEAPPGSTTRFGDDTQALAWLDAERPNLLAVTRQAAGDGPRPVAWRLADALRGYFWLRMHAVDWLAAASAGLAAAQLDGEVRAQAAAHVSLGDLHWRQGTHRRAIDHYEQALTLARRDGWIEGQAAALGSLGSIHRHLGQTRQAADRAGQALRLYRQTGALGGLASALDSLGVVYSELGRLREAADHHAEALALRRRLKSRGGEAMSLVNLAEVYHRLGRLDPALDHLAQALTRYQEFGDPGGQAETLRILADVHSDAGRHAQALELAHAALVLARDSGDRRYEVDALNTLATAHRRLHDDRNAIDRHEEAVTLARDVGDRYAEAEALIGLAATHRDLPDCDQALSCANQALALTRQADFRMLEGRALTTLAAIHLARCDPVRTIEHGERALAIHRETGHQLGEAYTNLLLGHAFRRSHQDDMGAAHWQRALACFTDIGVPEAGEAATLLRAHPPRPVDR